MNQIEIFDQNVEAYEAWFDHHTAAFESELRAINEQLSKLPSNIRGIEVGLKTGRFAQALGIREGTEASDNMRVIAAEKGIEVMDARAEYLPYGDLQFDFVLFVTISNLGNVSSAIKEAHRVLKLGGSILIGMIPRDSAIGRQYREEKKDNVFYRQATFYTVSSLTEMLKEMGFKDFEYLQTLFGELEEIQEIQEPREGWEEGSFVVIKGIKK